MDLWKRPTNDHNFQFYNNLGIVPFKNFAKAGGFDTFNDLEIIYEKIKDATCLLELGAGYGRCLDYLFNKNYQGKIYAVEYCPIYFSHLIKTYQHTATILNQDIKKLVLPEKVDVALWMWSGIIDFSRVEQIRNIRKISGYLHPHGKLILDLPRHGFQTIAKHKDERHLFYKTPYGNLLCYMPDMVDLQEYATAGNFSQLTHINYTTSTQKERTLHLFQK